MYTDEKIWGFATQVYAYTTSIKKNYTVQKEVGGQEKEDGKMKISKFRESHSQAL